MQATSNDVAVVVIPARYGSTRLPGKPLADLGGRPLIEHVWRRSLMATLPSRVVVATDDDRIRAALPDDCEVAEATASRKSRRISTAGSS
jgi:CMP-2-keto-3-deoxyoctulosonic acid synthetase